MDEDTKEEFEKIWSKIKELENKIEPKNQQSLKQEPNKKISIKEFLIDVKPNNDVKRTACIGYYLEKYGGKSCFTNKEITEGFKRAKLTIPLNVPDKIQKAISNGWFDYREDRKAYTLTISGENVVKNKFSKKMKNG